MRSVGVPVDGRRFADTVVACVRTKHWSESRELGHGHGYARCKRHGTAANTKRDHSGTAAFGKCIEWTASDTVIRC
jgi:hypothetical protein